MTDNTVEITPRQYVAIKRAHGQFKTTFVEPIQEVLASGTPYLGKDEERSVREVIYPALRSAGFEVTAGSYVDGKVTNVLEDKNPKLRALRITRDFGDGVVFQIEVTGRNRAGIYTLLRRAAGEGVKEFERMVQRFESERETTAGSLGPRIEEIWDPVPEDQGQWWWYVYNVQGTIESEAISSVAPPEIVEEGCKVAFSPESGSLALVSWLLKSTKKPSTQQFRYAIQQATGITFP